jgi:hypothetical protein
MDVPFVAEVADVWTDLDRIRLHPDGTLLDIFGDRRFGVVQVAEYSGFGQAGLDTGRFIAMVAESGVVS